MIISKNTKPTKHKNKSNKIGAKFEDRIQRKLEEYKQQGLAYMSKVPTEVKIIRGEKGRIINAFFPKDSKFVDFTGVVKTIGHCDIEAKTTANKTSFPLSNILDSEFEYMRYMYHEMSQRHLYYLIEFRELNEVYLLKAIDVENFKNAGTRKSLPIQWVRDNGKLIDTNLNFIEYILD